MAERPFAVPADALGEPYLLVAPDGAVIAANAVAAETLGIAAGDRLSDRASDPDGRFGAYLRLCATAAQPLPGGITLADGRAFRTDGFRFGGSGAGSGTVCVRLRPKTASAVSFATLNDTIAELSREIRARLRTEERLRGALAERDALIGELHHRIRNTLQVIASLSALEGRGNGAEIAPLLTMASRLHAVGIIYRHVYGRHLLQVPLAGFVPELGAELAVAAPGVALSVEEDVEDRCLELDRAVPFALLVHDLLAAGFRAQDAGDVHAVLSVRLMLRPDRSLVFDLRIDRGRALEPPDALSARVLEGLARQIGGQLDVTAARRSLVLPCGVTTTPADAAQSRASSPEAESSTGRTAVPPGA